MKRQIGVPHRFVRRRAALWLLAACLGGLAVGGLLHAFGLGGAGDRTWAAVGSVGAAYSAWTTLLMLWRRRLGVDLIAVAALVGALAVGENLAAAVIAVMVTTGSTLEDWASRRAERNLRSLLERAPRSAHRYK
ncbi:MAG TPA: heavy metal translocating P-type ATPase, partial [Acidimicrobiia bacterium]|nr:heavy metal translocating P-type ATPase [Acidimicrobiia bacterium]